MDSFRPQHFHPMNIFMNGPGSLAELPDPGHGVDQPSWNGPAAMLAESWRWRQRARRSNRGSASRPRGKGWPEHLGKAGYRGGVRRLHVSTEGIMMRHNRQ